MVSCDQCDRKSGRWTAFPTCVECGEMVCRDCARRVWEDEGRLRAECWRCWEDVQEEEGLDDEVETSDVDFS